MRVAITGASGYVGSRLIGELVEHGHDVVALVRTPAKLAGHAQVDAIDVRRADVRDVGQTAAALDGVDVAYYLIHSMDTEGNFAERDAELARQFVKAADQAGVSHIVYLGGLGPDDGTESAHLHSRHEVGRLLAEGEARVTELRAAIVLGSGSASFEMVRNLVEVLPVMVTPKWVGNLVQPIAIRDVLTALRNAAAHDDDIHHDVLHIGGPDVMTYRELMDTYAEAADLPRRVMIPVPVVTPKLSSHWVGLVTPIPTGLAKPLVESLEHDVVVTEPRGRQLLGKAPLGTLTAMCLALERIGQLNVPSRWSGASLADVDSAHPHPDDPDWAGGTLLRDTRTRATDVGRDVVWQQISSIGGSHGWYSLTALWELRGLLDQAVGGVGLRRGRRHPNELLVGDALDFWRVEAVEVGRHVRLRAEMLLPGDAWLEFELRDRPGGGTLVQQRALFHPRGLSGRAYWYSLWPVHEIVFPKMLDAIVERAEDVAAAAAQPAETATG